MPFPRLQKRGPIEAVRRSPLSARLLGFHAYKSVAPLKLYHVRPAGGLQPSFPRLQKRGPIEAALILITSGRSVCFHAYKSVAPLKH